LTDLEIAYYFIAADWKWLHELHTNLRRANNFDPTDPKQLKEVMLGAREIKQQVEANNQDIAVYLNGSVVLLNQTQQAIGETFGAFLPLTIIIMFSLLFFLFRCVGLVFAIVTTQRNSQLFGEIWQLVIEQ